MKITLLGVAVALAALAVGSAASGRAASSVSLPPCPKHAPKFNSRGLTTKRFVRPEARLARVCRYYNVNWGGISQVLWQHRLVADRATVAGLTRSFNKLKEPPRGIFCIRDDGSEMLVIFGYAGSGPERVVVKNSGCQFATNGWATRATTASLQRRLRNLAKGR